MGLYLEEVKKIIQLSDDQSYRYEAFVMEKKNPVIQTKGKPTLKDGIHIVFPYLNMFHEFPNTYIINNNWSNLQSSYSLTKL